MRLPGTGSSNGLLPVVVSCAFIVFKLVAVVSSLRKNNIFFRLGEKCSKTKAVDHSCFSVVGSYFWIRNMNSEGPRA